MSPFRLAVLNLVRRKVSALIALAAIALSVASSGVLLKLYILSGSRFATIAAGGDAVVGAKAGGTEILLGSLNLEGDYPGFLPYKLFESLRPERTVVFSDGARSKPSYLRSVIPVVYFGRYGRFRIVGTDESFVHRPRPADAPALAQGRWATGESEVTVGSEVARRARLRPGDTLKAESWAGDATAERIEFALTVVGVFAPTGTAWDRALFSTVDEAHRILGQLDLRGQSIWGADVLNYFLVYLQPGGLRELEALVNERTVGQVIVVEKEKGRLRELTGTGRRLGGLMTALIMVLGGLCVTAMMVTRFDAMTVQLAVLRAIGYARAEIAAWLVCEGLLLGAAACLIGGLADALAFPWIRGLLGSALPAEVMVPSPFYLSAPVWATAVFATVLAVFIPLYRLYHQDIHGSLKGL